jgi:hypothetical protein
MSDWPKGVVNRYFRSGYFMGWTIRRGREACGAMKHGVSMRSRTPEQLLEMIRTRPPFFPFLERINAQTEINVQRASSLQKAGA